MTLTDAQAGAIVQAVREVAAAEIMPRFRALAEGEVDAKSAPDDLVTVADRAAEAALTDRLHAILPGDGVVGEEAVAADASVLDRVGAGRVAIVDPIDGTWNYAHGLANFGVIVAVLEEGEAVWGLLYDPSFDDWVEARLGGGAAFHRQGRVRPLRVDPSPAPLETLRGNVGGYLFPEPARSRLAALSSQVRRSASLGASVHEYRQQVLGGTDFTLTGSLHVWDHAAGVLALREAGGVARLLDGRDYAPTMRAGRVLTARSEGMWHDLAEAFAPAFAD
jgi:fructose-1,6-bisphosphatase/inositol monophosphatase family enzyme